MTISRVYLVQHGLAVDKTEDPERPLSKAGIQQTSMMADTLLRAEVPVSSIFHSGKLRALQTAEIIANTLGVPDISCADGMSPNDDVTLLAQNLKVNNALYVGHLPQLDKLVTHLVTGNVNDELIKFKNSGVLCLSKQKKHFLINWYLTTDTLD